MNRRILVPVSRGAASDRGVMEAVRLARGSPAVLRFVHVVDEPGDASATAGSSGTVDEFLTRLALRGQDVVEGARSQALAQGVACDVALRECAGYAVWEAIAHEAAAWRASLIVMGAAPAGGFGLRPGSIGARVLQSSPVPVMAIAARPGRKP